MPAKAKAKIKVNRECQREVKYTELQRLRHAGNSRIPPRTTEPNQTAGRAGKKTKKRQKKPGLDRGNDTLFNVSERLAAWPLKSRPCGAVHTASHFDSASRGCAPTNDGASVDTQVKPDPLKPLHRYQTAAFLAEAAVREA
ncbi:hypothetical protein [Paraburkholderia caribensis]|uniref:hypothetical protein n=1 Tax=Paraburkholderia caribensis TaxID=75105 RepID=UPI0011E01CEA|nr:hypothetical protein [Paraburkholderia caribensis]